MRQDWLETLRRKHQRAIALRAELAEIEAELRDARAILSDLDDAPNEGAQSPTKPKSRHGFTGGKRARPIQQGSSVWWSLQVLRAEKRPLTTDELIERVNERGSLDVKKPTLVSNLSRYVQHRDTFTRPAPSTYGLVEWDGSPKTRLIKYDPDDATTGKP